MDIPKSLEELVLTHANLQADGMEAFRKKDYARAAELLSACIDKDKNNWEARLYLAMALYQNGQIYSGATHFKYLKDNCPIQAIRTKAETAVKVLSSEMRVTAKLNAQRRVGYNTQPP